LAYRRIDEHFPQLRRYSPELLETFHFQAALAAMSIIDAMELLRKMNRNKLGSVPSDAPTAFVRKGWRELVFGPDGIDRRFYELCVMTELKNALRSGDVSVVGSRQFRDFEDYLIPQQEFDRRLKQSRLHVSVPISSTDYLEERMSLLCETLHRTDALAREGDLPDVELNSADLKISPIENSVPKEALLLGTRSTACCRA
jgi:hypothetical protein